MARTAIADRHVEEDPVSGPRQFIGILPSVPTAIWVAAVDVALFIAFGIMSHGLFFTFASVNNIGLDAAVGMLLAVGITFVLAAGELDLSIGSNVVMSSVAGAYALVAIAGSDPLTAEPVTGSRVWLGAVVAALAAMAAGAGFGLINGLIVTRLRINSFIATLASGGAAIGAVLVITNGYNISRFPPELQSSFGTKSIAGLIPYPMVLVLALCVSLWFLMRKSKIGVHTRAIGSSREAAVRSGIGVSWVVLRLFVLMGLLAGLCGFMVMSRFATTDIGGDQTYALAAIAAAVIGGTSLFGGVASVGGSMVGSLLPIILGSGLIVVGVSSFYQQIVVGGVLLVAVYVDQQRRSKEEK
jgi:ribose transport system permease protein